MPEHHGITITLHSQFDIKTLPEYWRSSSPLPFFSPSTQICNSFVPTFPGSQFWISYSIAPPIPSESEQYFLFKLFIDGEHVQNWSCGKEDGWKGKMMFGLFMREEDEVSSPGKRRAKKKTIEKRALRFASAEGMDESNAMDERKCLEIRIHRAHGRKRVAREVGEYQLSGAGIELSTAGRAPATHPKRFYKFALIDPLDEPYINFRYFYRTWPQLAYLGLLDEYSEDSRVNSQNFEVISPDHDSDLEKKARECEQDLEEDRGDETDDSTASDSEEVFTSPSFSATKDGATGTTGATTPHTHPRAYAPSPPLQSYAPVPPSRSQNSTSGRGPGTGTYIPTGAYSRTPTSRPISTSPEPLDPDPRSQSPEYQLLTTLATNALSHSHSVRHRRSNRLSVPPSRASTRFAPPAEEDSSHQHSNQRPLPTIPKKKNLTPSSSTHNLTHTHGHQRQGSTTYRAHPAYDREEGVLGDGVLGEWIPRTPSPVKSIREGISTPPLGRKRGFGGSATSLMNAVAGAWKRRGASSAEYGSEGAKERDGGRSVSGRKASGGSGKERNVS